MQTTTDLLELWLEIYGEAVELCDVIDELPDHCERRDADAHLEGRCPCCRKHQQQTESHGHASVVSNK